MFDIVERNKAAPIIQRFMRGHLAREKVSVELHKSRMRRHLKEQEAMFSGHRQHILESLQVHLAYIYRRAKAKKLAAERKAKEKRIRDAEEAKKKVLREKRARQRQIELKRQEEQR